MIVGGAVRDWVLGQSPKDLDIEVFSLKPEKLESTLSTYGEVDFVGKSFGIYKLRLGKEVYDFSLPRKDSKIEEAKGHKSFEVKTDHNLTPLEASLRRDFTINSLFYDPIKEKLMDPHGGLEDLKRKVLRHTSLSFSEDPLRSLRAVQFAARFNLTLDKETARLCQTMHSKGELHSLSKERVREEITKFLLKGKHHTSSIEVLRQTMWLELLPELKSIDKVEQDPQWHPEGDVLKHTFHALEALQNIKEYAILEEKEKLAYCLGVLCHDLGKPLTTYREYREELKREVITSPNHPRKGLRATESLLTQLGYGDTLIRRAKLLTLYHMEHLWVKDAKGVRRLACQLSPTNPHSESPKIEESIQGLALVVEADHSGRPPLEKGLPEKMKTIMKIAERENCLQKPPKPLLKGSDLISIGLPEGKALGSILKKTYKRQVLEGQTQPNKEELNTWVLKNFRRLVIEGGGPAPLITGEDIKSLKIKPSKEFSTLLSQSYKSQLSGEISNKEQAMNWLKQRVKSLPSPDNILAI
jgi:tRNA nucleotidyltransferase (CCA-adding enzyme)